MKKSGFSLALLALALAVPATAPGQCLPSESVFRLVVSIEATDPPTVRPLRVTYDVGEFQLETLESTGRIATWRTRVADPFYADLLPGLLPQIPGWTFEPIGTAKHLPDGPNGECAAVFRFRGHRLDWSLEVEIVPAPIHRFHWAKLSDPLEDPFAVESDDLQTSTRKTAPVSVDDGFRVHLYELNEGKDPLYLFTIKGVLLSSVREGYSLTRGEILDAILEAKIRFHEAGSADCEDDPYCQLARQVLSDKENLLLQSSDLSARIKRETRAIREEEVKSRIDNKLRLFHVDLTEGSDRP